MSRCKGRDSAGVTSSSSSSSSAVGAVGAAHPVLLPRLCSCCCFASTRIIWSPGFTRFFERTGQAQPYSMLFPICSIWAACAAGGRGGLLGAAPLRGPLCTPPGQPPGAFHIPSPGAGCAAPAAGASSLRSAISLRAAQCHQRIG